MAMNVNFSGNKLVNSLIEANIISKDDIIKLEETAISQKVGLVRALMELHVSSKHIFEHAIKISKMPIYDVRTLTPQEDTISIVSIEDMRKNVVFPLIKNNGVLSIAVADPTDQRIQEQIRFKSRMAIDVVLSSADYIFTAIDNASMVQRDEIETVLANEKAHGSQSDDTGTAIDISGKDPTEAAVVRFINGLLTDAIQRGTSDLHFEPYESTYRVRFRLDGVLQEVATPPANFREQIAARIKIMSNLDIAERRLPQDGRIKVKLENRVIDFRVSVLPTLWGEKIVMRILDGSAAKLNIDILGFEPEQKEKIIDAIAKPQGMILVTGPTGSGKTVTLYTCLGMLNKASVNISTAEDPVEINLEGINQVPVNPKVGLTFASALRAFLRQDPDIVMVGEIRDLETADIAIKAAQTGHLVLSTLHTNSAPETLTRLINMGVETFNIASTVHLIVAQRLARRLCSNCKEEVTYTSTDLLRLGFTGQQLGGRIFGPVGCDQCNKGYKGRVGIYEVMPISDTVSRMIMDQASSIDIADQAQAENINNLRQSAILKVLSGLTSIDELLRVTSD